MQKCFIKVNAWTANCFGDKQSRNQFFEILKLPVTDLEIRILKNHSKQACSEAMEQLYEILTNNKALKFFKFNNGYNGRTIEL
jgi:5-bromo-4-chloroindolyl phosphate hydrolysis protein